VTSTTRLALFAAICVACAAVALGYVAVSSRDDPRTSHGEDPHAELVVDEVTAAPHLLFRDTGGGSAYGRVAVSDATAPGGARAVTELRCDRVHVAARVGMCLRAELGIVPRYEGMVFDETFTVRHRFDLAGQPSRTQVSPDGSRAAYTVFVTGHSYAEGGFSTRTAIIDTATGREVVELEQLDVWRNGEAFDREDFNFWGVSFTDDPDRFYATLGTGGEFLLVEGDLAASEMHVLTDELECPSLSPDGTRLAFKERHVDSFGLVTWTLAVLDLRTMERWPLAEARDVDDQVEWLDDRTVMYGLDDAASFSPRTDVWAVAADGSGEPRSLIDAAWSPVAVGRADAT
jgi:hypothetical protein